MLVRKWKTITAAIVLGLSLNQTAKAVQTADINEYEFGQSTSTYTPLGDPTVTVGPLKNKAPTMAQVQSLAVIGTKGHENAGFARVALNQPLGFTFVYAGNSFTEFSPSNYGTIVLGNNTQFGVAKNEANANGTYSFDIYYQKNGLCALQDDMDCKVKYQLSGTTPNQVMTIEFYDVKWNKAATTTNSRFQIKLHETSNKIEYIYNMADAAVSASASIKIFDSNKNYRSVTPGAPATISSTTANDFVASNEFLQGGTTYSFTPTESTVAPDPTVARYATVYTNGGFKANWTPSLGNTEQKLYVSTDPACNDNFVTNYNPKTITDTNAASETVMGLAENTIYYYKVVALNGTLESADSNIVRVSTLTSAISDVTESFTTGLAKGWNTQLRGNSLPWHAETNAGAGDVYPNNNDGHYLSVNGTGAFNYATNWLISPVYKIHANLGAKLTYKVCGGKAAKFQHLANNYDIYISEVGSTTETKVDEQKPVTADAAFREVTFDIPEGYKGKDIQIAFVFRGFNSNTAFSIDDVNVETKSSLTTDKMIYKPGETITATFAKVNASDNKAWIGLYPEAQVNIAAGTVSGSSSHYKYLDDTQFIPGSAIESGTVTLNIPNATGNYKVLYFNDGPAPYVFDPKLVVDVIVAAPIAASALEPADDATEVFVDQTFKLSFAQVMTPQAGKNITINKIDGGVATVIQTIAVTTLEAAPTTRAAGDPSNNFAFKPTDMLVKNSMYTITVDEGAFKDATGVESAPIAGDAWSFSTGDKLTTPAYGVEVAKLGDELKWSADFEDGVVSYNVEKKVNGTWTTLTAVAAKGEPNANYSVVVGDGEFRITAVDGTGFTQSFATEATKQVFINLNEGWNLISVPFDSADLAALKAEGALWTWDGTAYKQTTDVDALQGVWVFSTTVKQVAVSGTKVSDANVNLATGWNLVGPAENCKVPAGVTVFSWEDTYQQILENSAGLIQGHGYWMFADKKKSVKLGL